MQLNCISSTSWAILLPMQEICSQARYINAASHSLKYTRICPSICPGILTSTKKLMLFSMASLVRCQQITMEVAACYKYGKSRFHFGGDLNLFLYSGYINICVLAEVAYTLWVRPGLLLKIYTTLKCWKHCKLDGSSDGKFWDSIMFMFVKSLVSLKTDIHTYLLKIKTTGY